MNQITTQTDIQFVKGILIYIYNSFLQGESKTIFAQFGLSLVVGSSTIHQQHHILDILFSKQLHTRTSKNFWFCYRISSCFLTLIDFLVIQFATVDRVLLMIIVCFEFAQAHSSFG